LRKLLISFGTLFVLAVAGRIYLQNNRFNGDKITNVEFGNWFGRYGSYYEAKEACEEWVLKGGTYQVEYKNGLLPYDGGSVKVRDIRTRNLRECFDESRTNQVIGLTQKRAKEGGSYDAEYLYEGNANKSRKVIKKFKY
tara:strand:- start:115 stop:531 length:417 start_codon:yes stop_codon:yes gene_type:complete